jgi:hypothetical protein
LFGTINCVRMSSASTPANRKNANAMDVYHVPTSELFTADQYRHPCGVFHAAFSRSRCALSCSGSMGPR